MISYVKGNLFDSDAQALVNTVNTVGVMGKGIALQFKEAFPDNYRIYRKACKEGNFSVGQMLVTSINDMYGGQGRLIINFPTKTDWRKPSEYVYIEEERPAFVLEAGLCAYYSSFSLNHLAVSELLCNFASNLYV